MIKSDLRQQEYHQKKWLLTRLVFCFTFILLLVNFGCGETGQEFQDDFNTGSGLRVLGTVKDAQGNPIEGAKVLILGTGGNSVMTDKDGEYRIDDVPAGTYNIEVTKAGYKDVLETITIDANDQPTLKDIVMEMN